MAMGHDELHIILHRGLKFTTTHSFECAGCEVNYLHMLRAAWVPLRSERFMFLKSLLSVLEFNHALFVV